MEFDSDWLTLGRHRLRLRCVRGFPTEKTRAVAELARIAIDNNLSAAARLVEVSVTGPGKTLTRSPLARPSQGQGCDPHLELALATMLGIPADHLNMEVEVISRRKWIHILVCMNDAWQRSLASCCPFSEKPMDTAKSALASPEVEY